LRILFLVSFTPSTLVNQIPILFFPTLTLLFPKLEGSKSEAILISISLQKTVNEPAALLGSFTSVFLLIPLNPTLRRGLSQLFQSLHDGVFP